RRRGIIAHEDDAQTGRASRSREETSHSRQALAFYLIAYAITIQDPGHQTRVADMRVPLNADNRARRFTDDSVGVAPQSSHPRLDRSSADHYEDRSFSYRFASHHVRHAASIHDHLGFGSLDFFANLHQFVPGRFDEHLLQPAFAGEGFHLACQGYVNQIDRGVRIVRQADSELESLAAFRSQIHGAQDMARLGMSAMRGLGSVRGG